jgi:hypothetical protein
MAPDTWARAGVVLAHRAIKEKPVKKAGWGMHTKKDNRVK